MLFKRSIALTSLFLSPALTLPTEQQPLNTDARKSVQAVREAFKKAEIIPTVIDDFLPTLTLSVHWPHARAKLGNTINPKYLQDQPSITLHGDSKAINKDMKYVVTLTDPDAPSRENPKWSEMCHWIAYNVSISTSTLIPPSEEMYSILPLPEHGLVSKISKPDDVMPYKPPGPPPKTGKHRYVFLVFAPKNGTSETLRLTKPGERKHWGLGEGGGVRKWAAGEGLGVVGGEYVYAQNDEQ